jgi:hypothetical protein
MRRGSFDLGGEDLFWMDDMLVKDSMSENKKAPEGAFLKICHAEDSIKLNLLLYSPLRQFPDSIDEIPDYCFLFV